MELPTSISTTFDTNLDPKNIMSSQQSNNRVKGLIRCESCTKSFATRGQYNRHRKTHTKPYQCCHCSKGFALRNDLDRHKTQHGGRVDTKFYCKWPDCRFKGAVRRDNLLKHIRKAHEKENTTGEQEIQGRVKVVYQDCLREQKTSTERLSFMKAVHNSNIPMVMLLLQTGADISERNDIGQTSLHVAALNGDLEMVQVLLDQGIDTEAKDNNNMTAVYAARNGNEAILQILVQHCAGASITERQRNGSTLLHHISSSGHDATVRLLVDQLVKCNADVDTLDSFQNTALHQAVTNGHSTVVATLLAAGAHSSGRPKPSATVYKRRVHYRTAVQEAVIQGNEAMVDTLIAAGADVNLASSGYFSPRSALQEAIGNRHEQIVEKLIAAGANLNLCSSRYKDCQTALQQAAAGDNSAIVEKLILAGADVNLYSLGCDSYGTALQQAAAKGHSAIVEKLILAGANVNLYSPNYFSYGTALQQAAAKGYIAIVERLILAGADVNLAPPYFNSCGNALQQAKKNGHWAIMGILVAAGAKEY